MLLGAFGSGFLIAWLLFKDKKEIVEKIVETRAPDTKENTRLEELLRATEADVLSFKSQLADCETKSIGLEAEVINLQASLKPVEMASPLPGIMVGTPVFETPQKDDLKAVEGIGPKIQELLNNASIYSFFNLSGVEPEKLKEILAAAGPRYQMHDPSTWPQQAQLAFEGKWDELKRYQNELDAGKAE